MRHVEPKCEISFDLTKFTAKTEIKDIKYFCKRCTGKKIRIN